MFKFFLLIGMLLSLGSQSVFADLKVMLAEESSALHAYFANVYDTYEPEKKRRVKEGFRSEWGWKSVAKYEGYNYLVNGAFVQNTPNGLVQAGIKIIALQEGDLTSERYSIIDFEFDCERRIYRMLSITDYPTENSPAQVKYDLSAGELEPFRDNTVIYEIARPVCMMNYALTH